MYVKKFRGTTVAEALAAARSAMGEEALLLSVRRSGAPGAAATEITVAHERPSPSGQGVVVPRPRRPAAPAPPPLPALDEARGPGAAEVSRATEEWTRDLEARFDLLTKRVRGLSRSLTATEERGSRRDLDGAPSAEEVGERLERIGLDPGLCRHVARAVTGGGAAEAMDREEGIARIADALVALLPKSRSRISEGRRVEVLVGPTGTGKTTTAIKAAAVASLAVGRSVALIAADDSKIGASDQVRDSASVLGVSCDVVHDADALAGALVRRRSADLVLVDTQGVAPSDARGMWDLGKLLLGAPGAGLRLVLSAATRRRDLAQAIARFRALGSLEAVITKLDETEAHGDVLSEAITSACPVAWVGFGRSIPDDFDALGARRLARIVAEAAWTHDGER